MELAIIIIAFIVAGITAIIGYSVGLRKVQEQERISNDKLIAERQSLDREINLQKQNLESISEQYQSKLEFINSAKERAENEYNSWKNIFEDKKRKNIQEAEELKAEIMAEAEQEHIKLCSLQKQKAATIEAFQREKSIQEQKDLYRIVLSEVDKQDIEFLRSIQYRISKPRLVSMLIWQNYVQPLAKKKFPLILGSNEQTGIYKITNIKNQLCYVGQAVNVYKRWNDHLKAALGIDTPQGNKLYQAMAADGIDNYTFELLETCEKEQLNEKEQYYIDLYNSVAFGYNSQSGIKGK